MKKSGMLHIAFSSIFRRGDRSREVTGGELPIARENGGMLMEMSFALGIFGQNETRSLIFPRLSNSMYEKG